MKIVFQFEIIRYAHTFTERQYEFGQRTGSKSLMPVIVPIYLRSRMNKNYISTQYRTTKETFVFFKFIIW